MRPIKRLVLLIFVIISAGLTACSKEEEQTSKAESQTSSASETTTPAATMKSFDGMGYRVVEAFNVGSNVYVRSMTQDKKNNVLWVGTSVGVLEVDMKSRDMLNTYTRDQGLANEYVFGMMVDSEGAKWFGTNGGGVTRYQAGNWKTYFPMHGLADYWVYSFAEQSDGTLWVGTWAGLNAFDKKTEKFTTYLKELVNEWVYGLDVDSKDRVWVGTEGGINMFDGKQWHVWTHKDGLGAANIKNLPLSENTGLGTRSRHDLNVIEQGQSTYNPNYVFTLLVTPEDNVWAGTWGGGASYYDGKKWQNYTTDDGLAGNIVYSVAIDSTGAMWFGTNGGLSRYDGKNWHKFTQKDGLLDNSVYAIVTTDNNDVWIGSRSGVTLLSQN